ncbi:response regulator transcription factor [Geodermatophilus maliterrae]|uniref:DNA-binding response regulator n=1 Tax=Geodermatophilus maliterrae TaxID=3162531 RepID=A0ABV3XA25_9ACTN
MIKVLIAEDMHMLRGALVSLLNLEPDIEVVAETSSGDAVLPAARAHQPDVAVLDIDLPGLDGLSVATELRATMPECRTLMLTSLGRPALVRRALDKKVNGFLLKDAPTERLVTAIREVAAGRRVIDSELALAAWETPDCPLAEREIQTLRLVAEGHKVEQIAAQLFLSPGTVRNYLTTAVTKLDARNRLDAVRIAREADWL